MSKFEPEKCCFVLRLRLYEYARQYFFFFLNPCMLYVLQLIGTLENMVNKLTSKEEGKISFSVLKKCL